MYNYVPYLYSDCFRTQNQNRSNNVNDFKFDTILTPSKENISKENLKTSVVQSAVVGRLSRQIETNLKTSADFYVPLDEEIQSEVISNNCFEKNTSISMGSEQKRSNRFSVSTPIGTTCTRRSGKTMLDKYFKAVKTTRRLQDLNTDKFIVKKTDINDLSKNAVDDYKQILLKNSLKIDNERTSHPKISLWDEQLFNRHLSIRKLSKPKYFILLHTRVFFIM